MPRPSIFEDNPYDVEKPESGVQHTTLGLAGAPTPIRVLDALGPPEMQLHDTKSIDLSFLHDSIQKGDPHSQLYAFHLHVSRRTANPTMGRPSWPDHAARSYSEPYSPRRRFGTHTSTPAHRPLSALHDPSRFQILVASRAILYPPFLSAAVDHTVRWKTTGPLPNLSHPSHGDLRR